MGLSKIEPRKNRIDHCSKVRGTKEYCRDSVFDITVDGDGLTPEFNYRIRGDHYLICFSD